MLSPPSQDGVRNKSHHVSLGNPFIHVRLHVRFCYCSITFVFSSEFNIRPLMIYFFKEVDILKRVKSSQPVLFIYF